MRTEVQQTPSDAAHAIGRAVALLCGVAGLASFAAGWAISHGAHEVPRRISPEHLHRFQPLATAVLAILLTWVWLERRGALAGMGRVGLGTLAVVLSSASAFGVAAWTGIMDADAFLAFMIALVLPLVVTVVPLMWLATRRLARGWMQASVLGLMVIASMAPMSAPGSRADAEMRAVTMNSCLIGLAAGAWLVSMATAPETRRSA